jgi:hypothetical protein
MKKKIRRFLKIPISIIVIWIVVLLTINYKSTIGLGKFLLGSINYNFKSNDPIPNNQEYRLLYDLVNLDQDHSVVASYYNPNEPAFNKRLSENNKINYYRMLFILKYLDSINVRYDTICIQDKYSRAPVYTCNIFIKPNESNEFTLITAHYDNLKIPGYQGALDNSASVAILLKTIQNCKEILKSKHIAFLFTTLEEQGFMGAVDFLRYSKDQNLILKKVVCLDGIGRGKLSVMNNGMGSFGFKFRDYFFREKLFTGSQFKNCPEYSKVDKSIIDLNKYNIKILHAFLSSTDNRVFIKDGIPAIHLTSSDIPHFLKVMHTNNDRIEVLDYNSLKQCQEILCDIIKTEK